MAFGGACFGRQAFRMTGQLSSVDEVSQGPFAKRNFYLGVLNGALFFGVLPLLNPGDFISLLTNELTGSSVAVGLISSLYMIGGLLPQVVLAKYIEAECAPAARRV